MGIVHSTQHNKSLDITAPLADDPGSTVFGIGNPSRAMAQLRVPHTVEDEVELSGV